MRSRSSKQESRQGMEIDKLDKLKQEPHLSGAYIRSLVKQLSSSRTKDPMISNDGNGVVVDDDCNSGQKMNKSGEVSIENQPTQKPQQQYKKQVRRRLHTSRPYQERLLNMAEARREIVAALKFHRASMKQANEQQQKNQQKEQDQQQQPQQQILSRTNPKLYPSNTANFSNYIDSSAVSCTSFQPSPSPYPFCWPTTGSLLPSSTLTENLNFPLPNQTLGLNLNFQDFNDLDTSLYHSSNNSSSVYSSSSPSPFSSPSPTFSIATEDVIPSVAKSQQGMPPDVTDHNYSGSGGLHQVMDDEEMAEIRSIGEQHQMEWNDTMNLVQSAWWFKFLKTMESGTQLEPEDDGYQPFDQVMEFPSWMNANDGHLLQHFDDYCSPDYYQDPSLPCMDIGEIEGVDGEWLS